MKVVTAEQARKKKKVSFAISEAPSVNNVAEDPSTTTAFINDTTKDTFESIFAVAAYRFFRAKPSNTAEMKDDMVEIVFPGKEMLTMVDRKEGRGRCSRGTCADHPRSVQPK